MCKESNPCYGCDRRQKGCHSSCEDYEAYRQANNERAEIIRQKKAEEALVTDTRERALLKAARKRSTQSAWKG